MAEGLILAAGKRYQTKAGAAATVTVMRDPSGPVAHDLPAGTVVVCAEISADAQRVRIGVLVTAVQKVPLSKLLKHCDKSRVKIVTH